MHFLDGVVDYCRTQYTMDQQSVPSIMQMVPEISSVIFPSVIPIMDFASNVTFQSLSALPWSSCVVPASVAGAVYLGELGSHRLSSPSSSFLWLFKFGMSYVVRKIYGVGHRGRIMLVVIDVEHRHGPLRSRQAQY